MNKSIKQLSTNNKYMIAQYKVKYKSLNEKKLKNCKDGINVLSLCDGISGGMVALNKLGIKVNKYFACEIKDIAIKTSQFNYPNIIHIGDVNNVSYSNGILHSDVGDFKHDIDLVIFGSPCQSFSIAMKTNGRIGLNDKTRSGLFLECYRILKETNPKFFLMENVASMKDEDRDYISDLLGVKAIKIDSQIISPALRKRYYWTNIPICGEIQKKDINLQDILDDGYTDRKKARGLLASDSRPLSTPIKMFHRYYTTGFSTLIFKSKQHYLDCKNYYDNHYKGLKAVEIPVGETDVFNGVRYMNQNELEKCQTLPKGYTSCLNRNQSADVIGDGWTISVIAYLFTGLKYEF